MDTSDWITFSISLLSFVLSFIALKKEEANQRANLMMEYYNVIFKDYVINLIPKAADKINFNNNKVSGIKEILNVFRKIKMDASFFKYYPTNLYDDITGIINQTEELLVNATNKIHDDSKYTDFKIDLKKQIGAIYEVIFKNYMNN